MIRNRTEDTNPGDNKGEQVVREIFGVTKQMSRRAWRMRSFLGRQMMRDRHKLGSGVGSWSRLYAQQATTESDDQARHEMIAKDEVE